MNNQEKKWLLGISLVLAGIASPVWSEGYGNEPPSAPGYQSYNAGSAYPSASAKLPDELDQGLGSEARLEWWYTSQGSRIIQHDWFLALERANSDQLIRSNENLIQRLRYIRLVSGASGVSYIAIK